MAIIFDGAADPDNVEFTDENANSTQIEKVIFDNVVVWESVNTIQYSIDSENGIISKRFVNGWYNLVFGNLTPKYKWRFMAFYQDRDFIIIRFNEGATTLHDLPTSVIFRGGSFPVSFYRPEFTQIFQSKTSRYHNTTTDLLWGTLKNNSNDIVFEFAF